MALNNIEIVLYILLAAIAGMIFSLRRIFLLEKRILALDKKITSLISRKAIRKTTKRRKRR